jgi:hypothetical protein
MSTKYLDLDSSRRNRFSYPNIGDFVIDVNNSLKNTPKTALDPIILAFPYETNLLSGGSTFTQIALSVTSSNIINFYRNSYLEIAGNFRLITGYDQTTQIATVTPPFGVAYPALTPYSIRKALPVELAPGGVYQEALPVNTPSNIFQPGPLALAIAGADGKGLEDYYVFIRGATPPYSFQWGRLQPIYAAGVWTGQYNVFTTNSRYPYNALLAGTIYEIMRFSRDNVVSLRYNHTENFNNPVCEKVRLTNIIVPTNNISPGYGTLQNYSHIYVAIYSEKGITYNNPIISNSPASNRALFKVPVTFLPNTSWITLAASPMTQNISFKENDSIHVTVVLPNGDVLSFEPYNQFTFFQGFGFPIESDPNTQLHCVVEITR